MSSPATGKNLEIECLRAGAVMFVMIEHLGSLARTGDGLFQLIQDRYFAFWGGVDVFFVISGFVITRSLLAALGWNGSVPRAQQRTEVLAFWIRRAWRLFPSSWLWIAVYVAAGLAAGDAAQGSSHGGVLDGVASLLDVQNFHRYLCHRNISSCATMGHYWSLSLEEQFYLILPLVWVLLPGRVVIGLLLGLICWQAPMARNANTGDLSWFLRTDGLAWGVLLALWQNTLLYRALEPDTLRHPAARRVFVTAAFLAIASIRLFSGVKMYPALIALASAMLVFAASFGRGYVCTPGRLQQVLAWIGARSFALYLVHPLCFAAVSAAFAAWPASYRTAALLICAGCALTALAADLNYRLLERPLTQFGRRAALRFVERRTAADDPVEPAAGAAKTSHH